MVGWLWREVSAACAAALASPGGSRAAPGLPTRGGCAGAGKCCRVYLVLLDLTSCSVSVAAGRAGLAGGFQRSPMCCC